MRLNRNEEFAECEDLPPSLIPATSIVAPPHVRGHPAGAPLSLLHRGYKNPSDWSPSPSLPLRRSAIILRVSSVIFGREEKRNEGERKRKKKRGDFEGFHRWGGHLYFFVFTIGVGVWGSYRLKGGFYR
ncbi:UNVERIFIED_CONTAM: hypothetical protein Sindi_1292500 [Sesamum indicum]